jgi:actin-related protein 2
LAFHTFDTITRIVSRNATHFHISITDASDRAPRHIIPSAISRFDTVGENQKHDFLCGRDALEKRHEIECSYPIQGGCIQNWNQMESLLDYSIDTLVPENFQNSESKILITEPPLNPLHNKKKMLEVLFESLDFGAVNMSNQALLVLYANGLLSGMVIDCGEGVTQIVPVYDGFVPNHLIKRFGVEGQKITSYLSSLLQLRCNSKHIYDLHTVKDMKEKLCYAAYNLDEDRKLARETTALVEKYTLPDGTSVKVDRERFECTEAFFDPSLIDMECKGLADFIFDTIQECDVSTRKYFYEHMVLS